MPKNDFTRRRFVRTATLTALAAAAGSSTRESGAAESGNGKERIIDIHQHVNFHGRYNDVLMKHQDTMGVSKTVLLPAGSQVSSGATHLGKSNGLAARVFGTEASARLAAEHPDRFVYFCNEVPDLPEAKNELEKWLRRDARGIGEQKFGLDCDSKEMQLVYEIAREFDVPVLLHFQHGKYNTAFERLPAMLKKYPAVNFIGHAQTWWGNIDKNHKQEEMYPKAKVTPGGLTDRYLSDYPNMFGDLSAGSGRNALTRDEEHAAAFLDRHQDKLCLGTDCADTEGQGEKCSGSDTISIVRRLVPDGAVRGKIYAGNAERIIRF